MNKRKIEFIIKIIKELNLKIDYELLLEKIYSKIIFSGETVIDIGAHYGRHLDKFKKLCEEDGLVIGFEPIEKGEFNYEVQL